MTPARERLPDAAVHEITRNNGRGAGLLAREASAET